MIVIIKPLKRFITKSAHEKFVKIWILLKDFEFAIDVIMKQKIDMNWTDTFGMDMKKIRMVMYSASFVMENL